MAKYLITGANGLIGSALCRSLLDSDNEIIAFVRNDKALADDIKTNPATYVYSSNVDNSQWVLDQNLNNVDYIIHTAAPTDSNFMVNNPVETIDSIVLGTKNVLEFAKVKNVKSTVVLSTIEVYGSNLPSLPLSTSDLGYLDPNRVRSSYPEGKRLAECYVTAYANEYQVKAMSARLCQSFGKEVKSTDNRVFMQFLKSAINNQDIKLATDGSSAQMYIAPDDAVSAILTILHKGESGKAYNVANDQNYISMKDMANLVSEMFTDGKIKVHINTDLSSANKYPPSRQIYQNIDDLKALGWQPKVSLKEMYQELYNAIKNQ